MVACECGGDVCERPGYTRRCNPDRTHFYVLDPPIIIPNSPRRRPRTASPPYIPPAIQHISSAPQQTRHGSQRISPPARQQTRPQNPPATQIPPASLARLLNPLERQGPLSTRSQSPPATQRAGQQTRRGREESPSPNARRQARSPARQSILPTIQQTQRGRQQSPAPPGYQLRRARPSTLDAILTRPSIPPQQTSPARQQYNNVLEPSSLYPEPKLTNRVL